MSRKDKILNGNALYTFIAIIIGFVAGAVLLAVAGINPGLAYGKLLNGVFGQVKYITWSIVYAAPLILTGLSVAFSFRTGVFNIGAEGQFVVGSIAACTVGILFDLPAPMAVFLVGNLALLQADRKCIRNLSFYAAVCCSCIYALAHNCVLSNAVCTILYKFFSVLFQKFHCHFSVHLTVLLSLCLTLFLYASALKTYLSKR